MKRFVVRLFQLLLVAIFSFASTWLVSYWRLLRVVESTRSVAIRCSDKDGLPAGRIIQYSTSLFGFRVVGYSCADGDSALMLSKLGAMERVTLTISEQDRWLLQALECLHTRSLIVHNGQIDNPVASAIKSTGVSELALVGCALECEQDRIREISASTFVFVGTSRQPDTAVPVPRGARDVSILCDAFPPGMRDELCGLVSLESLTLMIDNYHDIDMGWVCSLKSLVSFSLTGQNCNLSSIQDCRRKLRPIEGVAQ